jgi:hypothetical protein
MYLAYVYRLTHKITKEYYIGYRYANIKLKLHPEDDLGKIYFTSSTYISEENFNDYISEIIHKTSDPDQAYDYENKLIAENWDDPLLLNRNYTTGLNGRFKITEVGIEKLKKTNTTKKWYNNGITEVHQKDCPEGFVQGRITNPFVDAPKGQTKGYKWYNNGTHQTMIKDDTEIPDGYNHGRLPYSEAGKKNLSQTMKKTAHARGKKWFTNGTKSILAFDCPKGWRPGHSNGSGDSHLNRDYSGYHWYNNGTKSVRAKSCPEGYFSGRLS